MLASFSTSCCQKEAVLDVVDMMGNKGRYHVTYELQRVSRRESKVLNLSENFPYRS